MTQGLRWVNEPMRDRMALAVDERIADGRREAEAERLARLGEAGDRRRTSRRVPLGTRRGRSGLQHTARLWALDPMPAVLRGGNQ